jgi:hypothetical protein
MPSAENAKLEYEAGQTAHAMSALTNSGDNIKFTSAASLFSRKSGYAPVVRPDGLLTGGDVVPAVSLTNNKIDVAALTCNLAGVKISVSAGADKTIARASTNVSSISSVTIDNTGAIAIVKGADGTDATFVETRGAAGGPPLIPVGSIEIAQVRTSSNTAAAILATQIFKVPGLHVELAASPVFTPDYKSGVVNFASALPLIHTGGLAKGVFASYADPLFAEVSLASDFKPAETSHSVTSSQIYGGTVGASSKSLGQGGFTAFLDDGVTDPLVGLKGENLWFRFYPDKYNTPYLLTQGILGITRTFPAGDNIKAVCTISAASESIEQAG